ncbi:uncharacterized protein LOC131012769 [Salvia miltiorrhiza]|uniref:uncharacterized protein LOC131012769 n=1 Tax=Salvia miltiorrhiza TaxID=226208 RepID=UPI0025AC2638|nr:uncharacterized protein LOC131012769 [Salvia miltiorrhiza]
MATTLSAFSLKLPTTNHKILSPPSPPRSLSKRSHGFRVSANLGGGGEGEMKKGGKKKFITKEQEPEQYWQSAGEREGENPMKTPLPYIIIFGMSTPFVILAIAFANGWIKVPVR